MTTPVTIADRHRAPWPREILGGATGSVVMLAVVMTLGMLSCAPLGRAAVTLGVTASFVTATVGGVLVALLARSPMPAAGPSSATALIFASLVAQLARDPQVVSGGSAGVATVLVTMSVTVVLMGVLQLAMAGAGFGRLAQFVPQPVLAGFMNGVAVLIVISQIPTLLGLTDIAQLANLDADRSALQPATLVIGLLTAACTWLVAWRWPRSKSQLIGLAFGLTLYATLRWQQPGLALGTLVGPLPETLPRPDLPLRLLAPGQIDFIWHHAVAVTITAVVLALIGSLETALNSLAVDQTLQEQHDPSRELIALGWANIAIGVFGGLPAVSLRARAMATLLAGGIGRRAALAGAICFGLMYALLGPALALLPTTVLAGIMLTVAVGLADNWTRQLVRQWRSGERSSDAWQSLAIVALVCGITIWKGFAIGVAAGVGVALLVFVRSMNRSLLRSRHTAVAEPSRRVYPEPQEQVLQSARARILVLELEGALFFGSADRLAREADRLGDGVRFLVLDLQGVSTIDETGAMLLQQLSVRLRQRGVALLLAGVTAEHMHGRRLRAFGCFRESPRDDWFADIDRAVEFAEQQLLREAGLALVDTSVPIGSCSLFRGLKPSQLATVEAQLQYRCLDPGDTLFREGDPADGLYVLTRGSISVIAGQGPEHARQRFVSFSAGLILGETAMLDGGGRSASATADSEVEVHLLTQNGINAIAAKDPDLAAQLYRNIAIHLSERLRRATSLRRSAPA